MEIELRDQRQRDDECRKRHEQRPGAGDLCVVQKRPDERAGERNEDEEQKQHVLRGMGVSPMRSRLSGSSRNRMGGTPMPPNVTETQSTKSQRSQTTSSPRNPADIRVAS